MRGSCTPGRSIGDGKAIVRGVCFPLIDLFGTTELDKAAVIVEPYESLLIYPKAAVYKRYEENVQKETARQASAAAAGRACISWLVGVFHI